VKQRVIEIFVGFFVLLAIVALLILALRVSGLTDMDTAHGYQVQAEFDNIGGLKVGAPVSVAGVKVGEVDVIKLDPQTYRAEVIMEIYSPSTKIPTDSSASILTAGILGAQYIALTPGFTNTYLSNDQSISTTHSALILENLIGQLMFNLKNK
jgi:phospholipid/cholesterol/gamma-HCH transport system substrate-binding protein